MRVTCQGGDVFAYVSGRPSLDLTGTLAFRHHDQPIELLVDPVDVSEWALRAGLVHEPIDVSASGLVWTRQIREAIHTLMVDRLADRPGPQGDLEMLNTAAAGPPLGVALQQGSLFRFGNLAELHSTLARDALEVLGGSVVERVKVCAGEDCSRLYLDISRNATRRWCGMRQCGDKVKSANYRSRRRAAHQEDFSHDVH